MSHDSLPVATPPRTPDHDLSHEILIWDEGNPRSVLNIVKHPPRFRAQCLEAKFEKEELFGLDEARLYEKLRELSATPKPADNRLRLKFWFEYDYAQTYRTDLDLKRVCAGIMEVDYFTKAYMEHPTKVAWLLCPPQNYMVKASEALEYGLEQMRDILGKDHYIGAPGAGGERALDFPLAKLKLEIFKVLDMRVKGAPTQKLAHLHAHTTSPQAAKAVAGMMVEGSVEEMKKRLEYLKRQEENMKNGGMLGIEPPKETE
jgi:hypothetical protein